MIVRTDITINTLLVWFLIFCLLPLRTYAFSFWFTSNPTQCGSITVEWNGGTAPYTLLLVPIGHVTPEIRKIIQINVSSGTSTNFVLNFPAQSQFVAILGDASGFGTGGTSAIMTVGSSSDSSCLNQNPVTPEFYLYMSPTSVSQCQSIEFSWQSQAQAPVDILAVIPGGDSFQIASVSGSTSAQWTADVPSGTDILFVSGDKNGLGTGGSTDVMAIGGGSSTCINNNSPSSTAGSPAGGVATATSSSNTAGTQSGGSNSGQSNSGGQSGSSDGQSSTGGSTSNGGNNDTGSSGSSGQSSNSNGSGSSNGQSGSSNGSGTGTATGTATGIAKATGTATGATGTPGPGATGTSTTGGSEGNGNNGQSGTNGGGNNGQNTNGNGNGNGSITGTPQPSSFNVNNFGLIFGLIFGILLLVALLIGGFLIYRRIRQRRMARYANIETGAVGPLDPRRASPSPRIRGGSMLSTDSLNNSMYQTEPFILPPTFVPRRPELNARASSSRSVQQIINREGDSIPATAIIPGRHGPSSSVWEHKSSPGPHGVPATHTPSGRSIPVRPRAYIPTSAGERPTRISRDSEDPFTDVEEHIRSPVEEEMVEIPPTYHSVSRISSLRFSRMSRQPLLRQASIASIDSISEQPILERQTSIRSFDSTNGHSRGL